MHSQAGLFGPPSPPILGGKSLPPKVGGLGGPNRTIQRALDAIWGLPEVQRKAREIRNRSNGRVAIKLMVESEPIASEPFYSIRVFEDYGDRIATLYWFRVASRGGEITVQDEVTGEYISLAQWRKR